MINVIIGRFQTNSLHEGHLQLIREAKATGNDILILIGINAGTGTDKNPLNFEVRKQLFDSHFSSTPILPLDDTPSNQDWSNTIDGIIEDLGYEEAIIWAGRDNSVEGYYLGKHEIRVISDTGHSSTTIRKEIAKEPISCPNFRAGVIYHIENRYPIVYSTVDVILYSMNEYGLIDSVLMGKKGDKFHFIGGFVDPKDSTIEEAAKRELLEETGFNHFALEYEFSRKIDDSRYRGTKDSIMTNVFSAFNKRRLLPDTSKIIDKEFKEFRLIPACEESLNLIAPCHQEIFLEFINSKY